MEVNDLETNEYGDDDWATPVGENNEMNQQEIETKLKEKFSPVHIDLVDKSHTHTSDKHIETMKDKERLYDLTIIAEVFKPMSLVERHKAIYKELDIMNNPGIHGIKIKASSPDEMDKLKGWLP